MEYSGLLLPASFDVAANATGTDTSPGTGTTATTSQANELWIGSIACASSSPNLSGITNSFTNPAIAASSGGSAANNTKVFALERIATTTENAFSGGTLSTTVQWSGAIATFKTASSNILSLTGSAAANYTLTGLTGSVTITPKNLTATGLTASNRNYDGTTAAALTGTAALLPAQAPGSGSTGDGKPYTGDTLTLGGAASGTFATKHAATNKPVTVTGLTLGGTQAGNYTLTQPAGLSANIAELPITVSAVDASKTYDGTTTASGTPTLNPALAAGDTTSALSQSFQTPDAGTGNKVIVPAITIDDGNSGANYSVTLENHLTGTISPAAATVILGNLTASYDGLPKAVSVTTNPTDLATTVTYGGSSTPPTNAGSYEVVATVTDPDYTGSASDTLVITEDLMASWRSAHFSAAEIAAGLADDAANPDGDDFTNREEYVLGTDPRAFTPQPLDIDPVPGNQFTLTFIARRATGTGYAGLTRRYTVESTGTPGIPASWQPLTGHTGLVGASQTSDIAGDDQTVIVTLPATGTAGFHRLSVRLE